MSANLEQHNDRLLVLRVGGELKKSELDAVQSDFLEKIAAAGTVKLLVLLENFTGWERGEHSAQRTPGGVVSIPALRTL